VAHQYWSACFGGNPDLDSSGFHVNALNRIRNDPIKIVLYCQC